jgi:hypothetical protein
MHSTCPSNHRRYAGWTPARLLREAEKIGPASFNSPNEKKRRFSDLICHDKAAVRPSLDFHGT